VTDLLSLFPSAQIFKNTPSLKGDASTWKDIHDGQVFKTEGAMLTAVHCPGHTTDHMAFVLEEEDAMFTGDNVLGHGTAVFEDLATYLQSLEHMGTKFSGRAYPGHGDVIEDGKAKIKEYISHRKQREGQVLEVLGQAKGEQGSSSMEIVKVVYVDYPENLHVPAEMGVVQVLKKLEMDGRVEEVDGRWRMAGVANL
jgi:ribonuclease/clavin/mitogillin